MVPVWILAVAALSDYGHGYGYGEEESYGGYGYGEELEQSNEDVALRRHLDLVHRTVVFTNNLVALLRGPGSDEEQEEAAWMLGSLAWIGNLNQEADAGVRAGAIVSAGAIEPLVALMRGGSARAQEVVAWALEALAVHATVHADNQVAIAQAYAQAGAIEALVALVRGGNPAAQAKAAAAGALGYLAKHADNHAAIAHVGAIEPLVALLRSGSADPKIR